jgi:hypothetical protein
LLDAVNKHRQQNPTVPIHVEEPTIMLPTIVADASKLARLLDLLVGASVYDASLRNGSVQAAIELGRGFVAYRASWPTATSQDEREMLELAMARTMSGHLGGDMQLERSPLEVGDELTVTLIFPVDMS